MAKHQPIPKDLLTRGVEQVIVQKDLERKLRSGKKLRVKHGVDPTTASLHIGYATVYWKLRQLQDLGHTIVFLIGDFTGRFGDPTDKLEVRAMRDKQDVDAAAEQYLDQIKGILDLKKTEIRRNSQWYDQMGAEELLRLASQFTLSQMLERDMFGRRQATQLPIGLHEPIYPVLQGYDSVMLESDLTVIGTDQLFNELQARPLQERAGQVPQDVVAMSLLLGIDGQRKMSQSLGNDIGITESPQEQFGKVMRIPDNLLRHYFELATLVPVTELDKIDQALHAGELHPRDAKLRLAREVTSLYHGQPAAEKAETEFIRVFREKEQPSEIPDHAVQVEQHRLDKLLVELKLAPSAAQAQRLITQGAVKIDGAPMGDWEAPIALHDGMVVQVGKRKFRRIRR